MFDGQIKTSLEVGFQENTLPERLKGFRGRVLRSIPAMEAFPFEDAQFEVVMLNGAVLDYSRVKECHRVLRTNGRLVFIVNKKTRHNLGYTLPEIYLMVRDGFGITKVEQSPWWKFWRKDRTIFICATKKMWKPYKGFQQ